MMTDAAGKKARRPDDKTGLSYSAAALQWSTRAVSSGLVAITPLLRSGEYADTEIVEIEYQLLAVFE